MNSNQLFIRTKEGIKEISWQDIIDIQKEILMVFHDLMDYGSFSFDIEYDNRIKAWRFINIDGKELEEEEFVEFIIIGSLVVTISRFEDYAGKYNNKFFNESEDILDSIALFKNNDERMNRFIQKNQISRLIQITQTGIELIKSNIWNDNEPSNKLRDEMNWVHSNVVSEYYQK